MNYRTLTEFSEIKEYLQGASVVAFDFETAPNDEYRAEDKAALDAHKSHIVGISFSTAEGDAIYVPLAHRAGGNIENQPKVWEFLSAQLFENKCVIKVAHNLAFESMLLYARGIVVQSPCYDTIAASQMTLKSKFEFRGLHDSGLKLLAASLFGAEMPSFSTVTDGRHFDEMNPADFETVRYACADSDYTLRLYHKFNNWFDRFLPQHRTIVEQLESPTAVYCGMMKYNGIPVDRERMLQKQSEANVRSAELKAEIDAITGGVNIGANASTSAFKQYLFRDLGLPIMKLTEKEQEAADDASMQMLKEHCEKAHPELVRLFEAVQEYRKWEKLRSTYVDGYLSHINSATGCIHPDIMPLGTQTGRFAARNPNMQNCFDDQTEILTPRGFVRFLELTGTDTVAQWENGEIYFVKPDEIIAQDYEGDMVCIKNQHIDLCMTPEHRCLLQNRKNRQYRVVAAKDYGKDDKQLQAAQYHFGGQHLTPAQITLLAATQADGNYHDGGIDFVFSKARKYRRLLQAIQTADVPYSDHVRANGQVVIRLLKSQCTQWIMDMLGREKTWNCRLLDLDRQSVKGLLQKLYIGTDALLEVIIIAVQ